MTATTFVFLAVVFCIGIPFALALYIAVAAAREY